MFGRDYPRIEWINVSDIKCIKLVLGCRLSTYKICVFVIDLSVFVVVCAVSTISNKMCEKVEWFCLIKRLFINYRNEKNKFCPVY